MMPHTTRAVRGRESDGGVDYNIYDNQRRIDISVIQIVTPRFSAAIRRATRKGKSASFRAIVTDSSRSDATRQCRRARRAFVRNVSIAFIMQQGRCGKSFTLGTFGQIAFVINALMICVIIANAQMCAAAVDILCIVSELIYCFY